MSDYDVLLVGSAMRSLHAVPPRISEPLVAFIFGGVADNPRRRGKPLQRDLEGRWSARRGDYRIIYRIEDDTKTIVVLKIAHRSHAYSGDR